MEKRKKTIISAVAIAAAAIIAVTVVLLIIFGRGYEEDFSFTPVNPGELKQPDVPRDDPAYRDRYGELTPYETPVTVNVAAIQYGLEEGVKKGTTPENQTFNKIAKQVLNIDIKYGVIAASTSYDSKINLAIAAGQMPDMFYTTSPTMFTSLRDNGSLADLTEAFWHLNDNLLDNYLVDLPDVLPTVMKDGGIYALPNLTNSYAAAQRLYLRQDWLDIVGVKKEDIRTVADMVTLGEKFLARKDAIADTLVSSSLSHADALKRIIPFTMHKEITWAGSFSAEGIFNAHGSSVDAYFENAEGGLDAAIVSDETRNTLATLHEMYDKGILDREFLSKSAENIQANIKAGYVGMVFGEWWLPKDALDTCINNVDGASWCWIDLPAAGAENPSYPIIDRISVSGYNLVSSKCKNPEAVAKLINLFYDIYYSDDAGERYTDGNGLDLTSPSNGFYYQFVPVKLWDGVASIDEYERVQQVFSGMYGKGFYSTNRLDGGLYQLIEKSDLRSDDILIGTATVDKQDKYYVFDRSVLGAINANPDWKALFDSMKTREKKLHFADGYPYYAAYRQGVPLGQMSLRERQGWGIYHEMVDAEGSYAYVVELTKGTKKARYNEFYGASLSAMTTYGEYINSSANQIFTQIITGDRPLSDFENEFVKKVYDKNGGATILKQVNAWFAAQPKKQH